VVSTRPVGRDKLQRITKDAEVTRYLEQLGTDIRELSAASGRSEMPVGSIYLSVTPTNPASTLGYGTWVAFAQSRVLMGVDPTDPDFDTVLKTGGSKVAIL
jgi:hypothetical protein